MINIVGSSNEEEVYYRRELPKNLHSFSSKRGTQIFLYKNIVFWAQARYSYQNLDTQTELILRIFLFLPL